MASELRELLQSTLGSAYTLERELGGGGMSRVFVAEERSLGRRVVIKVVPPELSSEINVERFRREIQLAAQLQHPHIVPVLGTGEAGGLLYYTMPLVEGESLRARLRRGGELPIAEAVHILRETASALAYAHKHGIVHRDIKPDNVLLSDGYALVADFGVAKALYASSTRGTAGPSVAGRPETLTGLGVALGTPAYMAPEQATGDPSADHRTDLYAFGCMAYEVLTGGPPFAGRPVQALLAAHAIEVPEAADRRRSGIPPALARLVMRCLEKRPADRPQSADEVVRTLDALTGSSESPTARAEAPSRLSRRRIVFAASAITIVALAAAGAILRGGGEAVEADVVAVFPFRVSSADASLAYLREGMPDLIFAKLAGASGVHTADVRAVLSAWRRAGGGEQADVSERRASALAARLGAGQIIVGEVVGTSRRLMISAHLRPTTSDGRVARASVEGPPDSLTAIVDRLVAQLLSRRAGEAEERLAALTSTSLPALRAYLEGQALYRRGRFDDAARAYRRAVQIDSSFAAAASGLAYATGWLSVGARDSARTYAWRLRDRLSPVDRLLLEATAGARMPGHTPYTERLAAAERLTAVASDNAQAWFELGDLLYHFGAAMGIDDAPRRALRAFERSLALDSSFVPVAEHLPPLYRLAGDTVRLRRATALLLAADSASERADFVRWYAAAALGDSVAAATALRAPTRRSSGLIMIYALMDGLAVAQAERAVRLIVDGALTTPERRRASDVAILWALNTGRPAEAARWRGARPETAVADPGRDELLPRVQRVRDALFAGGDMTQTAEAAAGLGPLADAPLPTTDQDRERHFDGIRTLASWELAHGRTRIPRRVLATAHALAAGPDTMQLTSEARLTALTLEAHVTALEGRPDAAAALARLDSAARTVPAGDETLAIANLTSAKLWEQRGEPVRALRAVRRRQYGLVPPFLSTFLLAEGRLAVAAGDREGAIAAYRHYLALRHNPEPALRADVAHVRAELARLEFASSGR